MAGKIFISYRRDDDPNGAARVRDGLAKTFGESNLFMDVDNLLAGQRFDRPASRRPPLSKRSSSSQMLSTIDREQAVQSLVMLLFYPFERAGPWIGCICSFCGASSPRGRGPHEKGWRRQGRI
jgi:hypothetical protein